MSNVISFLEAMASDASLARMSHEDYFAAIGGLGVEEQAKQALRGRNIDKLNELLGGRELMVCGICAPDDETERRENVPDEQPNEGPDGGSPRED